MSKARVENLSDALFAIVFTLLIIEIHVPVTTAIASNHDLWQAIWHLEPLFTGYYISFVVLAMFWLSHHTLFDLINGSINRPFILINFLYLCFIDFVPFSASIIGEYPEIPLAFVLYGLNILVLGLLTLALFKYAVYSQEISTQKLSSRVFRQARIRILITPFFTLIGIGVVFISIPASLIFFIFPILFNIFPGGINFLERVFNWDLDK